MVRTVAFTGALAALAGPAAAQTAWIAAPTTADMATVYPQKARAAGMGGGVELACTTTRSGQLSDCDVVGEAPRGYGFGQAARKLARQMQAAGVAKDTELQVSITFPRELATGAPVTVKTAKWTALPSVDAMQAAVPKSEGGPNDIRVALVCDVQAGGRLSGCVVDREEPAGQGFGAAIVGLAPRFRADLMSGEGIPTVGAKIRLAVRFDLKPVEQAAK